MSTVSPPTQLGLTHTSLSPVNKSPTKQLWSFSKESRFPKTRITPCKNFCYNLPDFMNQRTTGFGVGDRFKVRPDESPPPGSYDAPTQFKHTQKARAFSFGLTRNAFHKVYLKNKPVPDTAGKPSPATYNVREVPGRDKL